jgi:hypothetical protein
MSEATEPFWIVLKCRVPTKHKDSPGILVHPLLQEVAALANSRRSTVKDMMIYTRDVSMNEDCLKELGIRILGEPH